MKGLNIGPLTKVVKMPQYSKLKYGWSIPNPRLQLSTLKSEGASTLGRRGPASDGADEPCMARSQRIPEPELQGA